MNRKVEQFIANAQKLHLTSREKLAGKKAVVDFMVQNPLAKNRASSRQHIQPELPWYLLLIYKPMFIPIVLIVALLLGGGTSLAAEHALPGDILYPVKVHVNEEVMQLATFGPDAKANLDISLADRRLSEAEQLAAANRLNTQTKDQLEAAVADHASSASQLAASISGGGNVDQAIQIQSQLEALLKSHALVLLGLSGTQSTTTSSSTRSLLGDFAEHLGQRAHEASDDETSLQTEVTSQSAPDVKVAAENKSNAAEHKIGEAKDFVEKNKDAVSADVYAAAQVKLQAALNDITQGKTELDAGNFAAAFTHFQDAMQAAQEAKLIISAAFNFGTGANIQLNASSTSTSTEDLRRGKDEHNDQPDVNLHENSSEQIQSLINQAQKIKTKYSVHVKGEDGSEGEIEDGGRPSQQSTTTASTTPGIRGRGEDRGDRGNSGNVNANVNVNAEHGDTNINVKLDD